MSDDKRHLWKSVAIFYGEGWISGERYRCDCGVERRIIYGTDRDGNATMVGSSWMYFEDGLRTDIMPRCKR